MADEIPPASDAAPNPEIPLEEEMPEFEELTPELMEDECLRGDVMLRWAVVLMAILLSWTTITDSTVLVKIRSGEYMLSHGILPPRGDVFSASAEGRPWVNLSWMSDLLLGGLHQTLGFWSLTLFSALTVALAFRLLSGIGIPGVSTWWSSACGFVALVALFPMFQPGPSTLTILGLAALIVCLSRESLLPAEAEEAPVSRKFPWMFAYLPVLFVVWVNVDSRAWLGLILLVAFMLGDALTRLLHKHHQSHRDWGIVLVTLIVAAIFSPWPLRPVLELFHVVSEQQALRTYSIISEFFPRLIFNLQDVEFWKLFDLYAGASLLLMGVSFITLVLNVRRLNWEWVAVWLTMNGLTLLDGSMVSYSALINAAIATLNGQDWYRNTFSMDYRIDTVSILWGRGGRAAMVLMFFAVAYLAINGAFMGPQGRRLGLGLDPRWSARIESLENDVVAHTYSSNIFPTLPSQGDLLIWIGKKPFIDSRAALYLNGKENLLERHKNIRAALFSPVNAEKQPDSETWKEPLQTYKTYDVLARLWGPNPPYDPMFRMLLSPDWSMTGLGAAGANFTRADPTDPLLKEHNQKFNVTRFSKAAFRPEDKPKVSQLEAVWPIPVSTYDRWLVQKLDVPTNAAELAAHYDRILTALDGGLSLDQVGGLAYLAIRSARESLSEQPNDPRAYRVLARAYRVLQVLDQQLLQGFNATVTEPAFETQILSANSAAVIAGSDDVLDLQRLLDHYLLRNTPDMALQILLRFQAAVQKLPPNTLDEKRAKELQTLQEELQQVVDQVQASLKQNRENGAVGAQLAALALNSNCPSLALEILEENLTELERSPEMKMLYGSLLMQTGRFDTALQTLEEMEQIFNAASTTSPMQPIAAQWRMLTAKANLGTYDLSRAVELFDSEDDGFTRNAIRSLLDMPFGSLALPIQYELWPGYAARVAANAVIEVPERWASLQLQAARAELEAGKLEQAKLRFEKILKQSPMFSQRAIVGFYLSLLSGKNVEIIPPAAAPAIPAAPSQAASETEEAETKKSEPNVPSENPSSPKTSEATTVKPETAASEKPAEKTGNTPSEQQ